MPHKVTWNHQNWGLGTRVQIVLIPICIYFILSHIAHDRWKRHVVVITIPLSFAAFKITLAAISLPWGALKQLTSSCQLAHGTPPSWDFPAKPEVVGLPAHKRHVPQDALDAQDLGVCHAWRLASWVCDATRPQQVSMLSIKTTTYTNGRMICQERNTKESWHVADLTYLTCWPMHNGDKKATHVEIRSHGALATMLNILQHIYA